MHVQAPTLTTSHRPALLAGVAGLASAAIAAGVIAISSGDDVAKQSLAPVKPAAVQSSPTRVWDGSPLLRGTESVPGVAVKRQSSVERVWDGSPILRGTALGGSHPAVTRQAGFPARAPEGIHTQPSIVTPQAGFPGRAPEGFHTQP
jgi:hypothetical protein